MTRRLPRAALALTAVGAMLLLASCTSTPDPEVVRDSLVEVTEETAPPEAAKDLDAETLPDPIVDPLDCTTYLTITARGTGEPSRGQLLSPVARAIAEARPDAVQTLDLDYPADVNVNEGSTLGVRTLIDTLNLQAETCPDQLFILLGYSQGALIVGDTLSDPSARLVGETVGELTADASERIIAVVLYGDPRFFGAEEYNYGTFDETRNGILPRPASALADYADRIRDYCVAKDFICQSSLNLDDSGHMQYYDNGMQQDGAAFAITRMDPPVDLPETDKSATGKPETDESATDANDSPLPADQG